MKVVILAGGFGTRLSERTDLVPKPMVEIGGRPILWHIMKIYAHYGCRDFIIAGGYKCEVIKTHFLNYHALQEDFEVDLSDGSVRFLSRQRENNWRVSIVDTGLDTMTGGRLKRLAPLLGGDAFCMTYGDGVADIDINALRRCHEQEGRMCTITAVHPKAHYGELSLDGAAVREFREKPQFRDSWINGGFMVLEPAVLEFIAGDDTMFEREPMERIARAGQLSAYRHSGYWQCMDTLRDVRELNGLWESGAAPWAVWLGDAGA